MPLSTFDGEATVELHEHYDAAGNLTGSTVVTRPGWSERDRSFALGLSMRQAAECPRGHGLAEQLAPDAADWLYVPDKPITCQACVALDAAAKAFEKHPEKHAMLHRVKRVRKPTPRKKRR